MWCRGNRFDLAGNEKGGEGAGPALAGSKPEKKDKRRRKEERCERGRATP